MKNYQKGFSFIGLIAAIATFFTGVAHVAPTSVPINSTSTIEVTQNYNNEINSSVTPPDNKPGAKLVPSNYVAPVYNKSAPTNRPTQQYSGPSGSTSDLKTYANSQYGFSFQYPSNWSVCENKAQDVERVRVSGNCVQSQSNLADYFMVRNIGDMDIGNLESRSLKSDTGWNQFVGSSLMRAIYYQSSNLNLVLVVMAPGNKDLLNKISASFVLYNNQTTSPSITVNLPNGGESFDINSPISVSWTQNYTSKSIQICLLGKTGGCLYTSPIIGALVGQNDLVIPASANKKVCTGVDSNLNCSLSNGYKIMISDTNPPHGVRGDAYSVTSDNYFTITDSSIISASNWQTFSNHGFQVQYPANTTITDQITTLGFNVTFQLPNNSNQMVMISSGGDCNVYDSQATLSQIVINGTNFSKGHAGTAFGGMESAAVANAYCTTKGGVFYKLFSKIGYNRYTTTPVPTYYDLEDNLELNGIINSFKFTN